MKNLKTYPLFIFLVLFTNFLFAQNPLDSCINAMDLNHLLGAGVGIQQSSSLINNFDATTDDSDPTTGWECFGEPDGSGDFPSLETTVWFTFTGDGEVYHIETIECIATDYIDNGDTQMAIYTGSCDDLLPLDCNENVIGALNSVFSAGLDLHTEFGTTYYIMIDAFNFKGTTFDGEFCIEFTQQALIDCTQLSIGEYTGESTLCFNESTSFEFTSAPVIPNIGPNSSLVWVVTTEDISGSANPVLENSFAGNFSPSEVVYTPVFANYGTPLPAGLWYFTPFIYGGAVDTSAAQDGALSNLDIANASCSVTGNSLGITFLPEFHPLTVYMYSNCTYCESNGDAKVKVTEGSGTYNYAWNNGDTTATIWGLSAGYYTVTISDATGCVPTVIDSVLVDYCAAVGDLEVVENITVSPNPTNDFVMISLETVNTEAISLQVLNITGQVVKAFPTQTTNATQYDLDLSDLAEGVYFAKFTIGNKVVVENIILVK